MILKSSQLKYDTSLEQERKALKEKREKQNLEREKHQRLEEEPLEAANWLTKTE